MRVSLEALNYVNNIKATERQLNFIRAIEDTLGYEFDFQSGTKQDATKYISAHIDEYRELMNRNCAVMQLLYSYGGN